MQVPGQFDYVIVGAGSAGCVFANRLSADPNVKLCLLEAGGKDSHPWHHIPIGYFFNFDNPRTHWRYRTEPEPGLADEYVSTRGERFLAVRPASTASSKSV
jgi:choline dehydrogenase